MHFGSGEYQLKYEIQFWKAAFCNKCSQDSLIYYVEDDDNTEQQKVGLRKTDLGWV